MSDCVSARSEHVKWEKDVRVWRQHLESSGFPNLMPDEKKKIEEGHEHATKECERLKGVMDTAVYQLLELDEFWPVLANDGSTDRQELIKMQADVAQLMASALAIKNGPEDSAETSAVGAKRKRPTADDGSQSFRQLEKELEKIGEDVTTLSGRVADQENDLTEQQEEIMANLNEKIDNKFTELKESWTKTTGHEKKKMRDLNKAHTELKGRVDDVELNSENTSSIVNELSREIEEVKTAAAAQRQEAAIRQEEIRLCTAKFEQAGALFISAMKLVLIVYSAPRKAAATGPGDGQGLARKRRTLSYNPSTHPVEITACSTNPDTRGDPRYTRRAYPGQNSCGSDTISRAALQRDYDHAAEPQRARAQRRVGQIGSNSGDDGTDHGVD